MKNVCRCSLVLTLLILFAASCFAQGLDIPIKKDQPAEASEKVEKAKEDAPPTPVGELDEFKGAVQARFGDQAPRVLAKGSTIYVNDVVFTGPEDKGKIVFYDESNLEIGPDSEVRMVDFVNDSKNPNVAVQAMKFFKGLFRFVTGQIVARNPESLQLESPLAAIGIRGTTTDHMITVKEVIKDGKPVVEVESELHALRATKTKSEVVVRHLGKTQILDKINESVFLRPELPGEVRPLSEKEMEDFANIPMDRAPFDPREGALIKGGAN